MDYDLAESLMDAGFPQIGKGRLIGPLNKLVWRSGDRVYVPTLEELIEAVARILSLLINSMTGGSPLPTMIRVALRRPLLKPSPAYGSRFKNDDRQEGAISCHHLIAITAHDVRHHDAPECPVGPWSPSSSCSRGHTIASRLELNERVIDARPLSRLEPAIASLAAAVLPMVDPTVPKVCQRGCLMFLRRFRKFTKRLNGLVKRMVGVAGFAIAIVRH